MENSLSQNNLIRLLKTFSVNEWKDFEKFAESPYFNKGRNYIPLIRKLKQYYPRFDSSEFTKQNIYDDLFPGKSYKESVMKSMLSRLNDVAEEFVIHIALNKNDNIIRERLFLKEVSSRGLKQRAEKTIRETDTYFENKKTGLLDFLTLRDYMDEVVNHHYNFNERKQVAEKMLIYKKYIIYSFLNEFLITKGSLHSQQNFWKPEMTKNFVFNMVDTSVIEDILSSIKKSDPANFVILNLFNLLQKSIRYPDDDTAYFELRDYFFDNFGKFDFDFKQFMMNSLSVLCSAKMIAGKPQFKKEGFNIRKRIYDENLYLFTDEKYMQLSEFRTAFIEALGVNETEWAEHFAEKYISKLDPVLQTDVKNFCKARLLYEKKDYDASLSYANKVNINQITFKIDLKNLISQIYYNTNSFEPLISLLDSYQKLLENSKSHNKNLLERHFNYVKFLKRLINLKLNGADESDFEMLKKSIEKENVNSKKWLLSIINYQFSN